MGWWRPGDKPLSEPVMICLLTSLRLNELTLKNWVFLNVILVSNIVLFYCYMYVYLVNTMDILSAL